MREGNAAPATLRRLVMSVCLIPAASHPAAAFDEVSMQLKWKHQFQFAGYYAALEQGFYRDAGLYASSRPAPSVIGRLFRSPRKRN
jgi:ABC-type nitrate/sulfonate/bicarbonate transport system substrate-binding protein